MRIAERLAEHADPEVAESLGIRLRPLDATTAAAPAGEPPVG
jgi:hypothetical protein